MDIRLVAYRRADNTAGTYDLTQFELDLTKSPNVVANYNWINLKEPDKRKASFSQTIKLPFTNNNNQFFENFFEVNLSSLIYNTKKKFNAILYVDSIPQLKGFIQLKSIYLNARVYEIALFGETADFFTDIKSKKLKDAFMTTSTSNPDVQVIDGQMAHFLTAKNVVKSWDNGASGTGLVLAGGGNDKDVMYPVIDYGHTQNPYSSAMFWTPDDLSNAQEDSLGYYGAVRTGDLKPAIRLQRLLLIIAQKAGYSIKSTFLGLDGDTQSDTSLFSRLFMTLANQFPRVQTIFGSVSGSEEPFIGFLANLNNFSTSALPTEWVSNYPSLTPYSNFNAACYQNLSSFSETFDPNGLFDVATYSLPDNIGSVPSRPRITFPQDFDGGDVVLSQGTFPVKVTADITTPTTTTGGATITQGVLTMWWIPSPFNSFAGDISELWVIPTGTSTTEWIVDLECSPGNAYELFIHFEAEGTAGGSITSDTFTPNITALKIESIQGAENTLMNGGENGLVSMYYNMPDVLQSDFVKDLINRFNLIIQTDPDDDKKLIIEPYQDFIDGGSTQYWTDKLDVSKEQVIKSTNELQAKNLKFNDLLDKDILNQRYNKLYDTIYGQYENIQLSDFAKKDFKNFSIFSPFIAQGIGHWYNGGINGALPSSDVALAYLFGAEEGQEGSVLADLKPKIFYYSGTPINVQGSNLNTNNNYSFHIYSSQYQQTLNAYPSDDNNGSVNKFPLCLQYNLDNLSTGVTATTKIFNWTYYSPNFNTGFTFNFFGETYSEKGYFNEYWSQYINEIYSDEARIMECYLNLSPADIREFAGSGFQNTYYIKNTLWRIISIEKYAVGQNKSTKVKLLKVLEKLTNDCGAIGSFTASGLMTWVDAETGASTTITNACCEEVNPDWTFIQTNATTGVGNCYSQTTQITDQVGLTTDPGVAEDDTNLGGGDTIFVPALMPTIQNNFAIETSYGKGKSLKYYGECKTFDNSTAQTLSFKGITDDIIYLMNNNFNYALMKLYGRVTHGAGTQVGRVGYFEYDLILTFRGETNDFVGTTGGALLKQIKDTQFYSPTINMGNFVGKKWSPTITGGGTDKVFWVVEMEITSMPIMLTGTDFSEYAIFQNGDTILHQNVDYLLWN
jgi:hypothetical protein